MGCTSCKKPSNARGGNPSMRKKNKKSLLKLLLDQRAELLQRLDKLNERISSLSNTGTAEPQILNEQQVIQEEMYFKD